MNRASGLLSPGTPVVWLRLARLPGTLLGAICVAVAYFLTARLGEVLAFPSAPVSALWAPNAILLATLLLTRRRVWWIFLAAVLAAHLIAQLPLTDLSTSRVLVQYVVNCATAIIGALAMEAYAPGVRRIDRIRTALALIVLAGFLAPAATSVLLSAAFIALNVNGEFWLTTVARVVTNTFAILTVVPLILHAAAWFGQPERRLQPARAAEACLLAVSLATVGIVAFVAPETRMHQSSILLYAPFAFLLWAAVRFGVVGACSSVLLLGMLATWGVLNQTGPFVGQSPSQNALSLVLFLVLTSVTLLLLSAALEERRALERANASSQARFRTVFAHNIMPTLIWNSDGRILDANETFFELTGYVRNDLESGRLRTDTLISRRGAGGVSLDTEAGPVERQLRLRDGRLIPVLIGGCRFPGSADEGTAYVFDLSSLRRAETERRQAAMLHSAVLASVHDQIVVLDQAGVIIEANQAWRRFVEHAASRAFERAYIGDQYLHVCRAAAEAGDSFAAELLDSIRDVLAGGSARHRLEFSRDTPEGPVWYELTIERLRRPEGGAVITRTDITAHKLAMSQAREQRQQLAHLGRAAVLGELSGAFAHELAQPLTSILGNAEAALQILLREAAGLHEIHDMLRDIIKDDVRAAEVIQRLRSMLSRGEIQRQPIDLNQVVRDVLALARSDLITRNVSVVMQLEPHASMVLADAVQMQQVVLNLVVNACESMAGVPASERRLTITTRTVEDGRAVECSIADRGCGIAPDHLERVFQPFVTTKRQGLGLGLAICRSIIEAHGGRLWAENLPDRGATLHFTANAGA